MKQDYKLKTRAGETVYTQPGNRGPHDMQILTVFPNSPWKTTLEYIGIIARLKSMVENRNYPRSQGYEGAWKLLKFLRECILNHKVPIRELCANFDMPGFSKPDGKCACGQPALPGDKWCRVCRELLDNWENL